MIIPTNKDLSREWFLQKLVKFARDKYNTARLWTSKHDWANKKHKRRTNR